MRLINLHLKEIHQVCGHCWYWASSLRIENCEKNEKQIPQAIASDTSC